MLQRFGESIRGWFAWVIIGLLAITFVAWGLQYYISESYGSAAPVAVVNGYKISKQALSQQVTAAQHSQEVSLGRGLTEQELKTLKEMTLRELINQTIVTQAAKKQGFYIGLDQVEAMLESTPQFQVNGQFAPALLQQYLYQSGIPSAQALYQQIRDEILFKQMIGGIQGSAFLLPTELQQAYQIWNQRRDFSFVLMPLSQYKQNVQVPAQEVQQYYDQHKADYTLAEKVQLSYVLLDQPTLNKQAHVTDAAMQSYYDANKANFALPESWHIARLTAQNPQEMTAILAKLQAGKKLTDLKATTQWVSAVDASAELVDILHKLKIGEVSQPLPTDGGTVIIELIAKKRREEKSFIEVKGQIKQILMAQAINQLLSTKTEQLANLTYTNATSLEQASKQLGLPIQTSPLISTRGEAKGLFSDPRIVSVAFSPDVLGGNNSNPVPLKDGGVMVLRVLKHIPSQVQPLSEVKADILNTERHDKAMRQLGLQAYMLQTKLPSLGLHWQQRENASRMDPSVNAEILQAVFSLPLNQVKAIELKDGYALIRVSKIIPGDSLQAHKDQILDLTNNLTKMYGQNEAQLYLNGLIKQAKVTIKDKSLVDSWST